MEYNESPKSYQYLNNRTRNSVVATNPKKKGVFHQNDDLINIMVNPHQRETKKSLSLKRDLAREMELAKPKNYDYSIERK